MSKEIFATLDSETNDAQLKTLKKILELLYGDTGADGGGGGIVVQGSAASGKVSTFSHDHIAVSGLANEVVRLSTISPLKVIRCFVVAAESNDNPMGITPSPLGSSWQNNTVKPGQTYELSAFGNIIDLAQYYITSDANFQFDAFYWLPPA